jgi:hypothetical protein
MSEQVEFEAQTNQVAVPLKQTAKPKLRKIPLGEFLGVATSVAPDQSSVQTTEPSLRLSRNQVMATKDKIKFLLGPSKIEKSAFRPNNVGVMVFHSYGAEPQQSIHPDFYHFALLSSFGITAEEAEKYYGKGIPTPADRLGLSKKIIAVKNSDGRFHYRYKKTA